MPHLVYLNLASRKPLPVERPCFTPKLTSMPSPEELMHQSHPTQLGPGWAQMGVPALQSIMTTPTEDLEEIRTLLARYCFAIDSKDAAVLADLFTEDGVFDLKLVPPIQGREALRQFVPSLPNGIHHFTTNEIIALDGDEAAVRAYVLVTNGSPAAIGTVGEYEDVLCRTPDGWRFACRTFTSH